MAHSAALGHRSHPRGERSRSAAARRPGTRRRRSDTLARWRSRGGARRLPCPRCRRTPKPHRIRRVAVSLDASFCGRLRRSSWLLVLIFAGACSESESAPEDARRALLRGLGEEIFLPTYAQLESEIAALDESVRALCDEPGGGALDDARDAWWVARAPLKRNELLAFGPYTDEPLRYGPKLDFWPANVDTLEDVLSGEAELSADAVAAFGASQKGFPAIEYLLFDPETELESAFAEEPRRCEYLSALVADLGAKARGLREAWDPAAGNYLDELVYAGRGSQAFRTLDIAFGEIVNRLVFTVENVRGEKLGAPAGTRSD